jgi:RHS repeat-associated protein
VYNDPVKAKFAVLLMAVLAQPPTAGVAGGFGTASRYNRTVVAADWIVTTGYEYRGALGNVSTRTTSIDAPASGNPSFSESYVWDGIGNLVSVSYPQCTAGDCFDPGEVSLSVTHSREQGLETQVGASLGGISAVYQYHPNLQLSRIDYGNNMDALFDQGTNGMRRPQRIRYQRGNGTVLFDSGSFKYDPMQNVEQMRRSVSDRSTFKYDAAGRLLYGRIVQNGADAWQDYHYDPFDNMTESRTDDGEWNPLPVSSATNRLVGVDFSYDGAGNLIEALRVGSAGQPRWELSYDPFQQSDFIEWCVPGPANCQGNFGGYGRVWTFHYGYDADDRRVITVDGNASTVTYALRDLDGQVLREYSGPIGTTVQHRKDFVYGAEGLVATRERGGAVRYFHKDHLGSPRLVTNASQGIVDVQHFYPYGAQIRQGGTGFDEPTVKYTGHLRDAHGLTDYMLGRTCAFPLFRFTSVDPGRDGWNLYSYAGNNPIKYVDPDGLVVELSLLSLEDQAALISGLNAFTGNTYGVNDEGQLELIEVGEDSSLTATAFVNELIDFGSYVVSAANGGGSRYDPKNDLIMMDFESFDNIDYGDVNPDTFNPGSTFVHEAIHEYSGLRDEINGVQVRNTGWTGPVVDTVNTMRNERNLPLRMDYVSERGSRNKTLRFNNVYPGRPDRARKVKRPIR